MDTSSGAVHAPPSHHARPSHVVAVLVGTRECPALREVILRETPVTSPPIATFVAVYHHDRNLSADLLTLYYPSIASRHQDIVETPNAAVTGSIPIASSALSTT